MVNIDLTPNLGLAAELNPHTLEIQFNHRVCPGEFWKKTLASETTSGNPLWKSLKLGHLFCLGSMTRGILDSYWPSTKPLYLGYRGAYADDARIQRELAAAKIRPDITVLNSGKIMGELLRTEGHQHLSGFPEVYEVVHGKAGFLLFKLDSQEKLEDLVLVSAEQGDHVLFPPGYQHISINFSRDSPLVLTDWVSTEARTDFSYIKKHNGAPVWVVGLNKKTSFGHFEEQNPAYAKYQKNSVRYLTPAPEIPELGLKKGEPMFQLPMKNKLGLLSFLNSAQDLELYSRAFVEDKTQTEC